MKLAVIGTGYVGLVSGACLADAGNHVTCIDIDGEKIARLQAGEVPIFEPGLERIVQRTQARERLFFTTDLAEGIRHATVVMIAVGTPQDEDGSADLAAVEVVARQIAQAATDAKLVVTKSTVPVGTADRVRRILEAHSDLAHRVASNPEFLKEGDAVNDFTRPDRIILGVEDEQSREELEALYEPFNRKERRTLTMGVRSAEMTKYAANGMLATRISFMNEMARLCDEVGADIEEIRFGIGSDSRIGPAFLYAGCGYGGSCFPKDVKALAHTGRRHGVPLRLLEATDQVNQEQRRILIRKVHDVLGADLRGKTLAVWGLAFKAKTDDMREAPALYCIPAFLEAGARVQAHDPVAMDNARKELPAGVHYAQGAYDALEGADALVIFTDWSDYRAPDLERIKSSLKAAIIIDGRNLYSPQKMGRMGFRYHCIGRPS
ncbi:MAG: UDP-glucose 6-dehydrogenase [Myxococcales bacterium]|nr:UDP-glucose 6-dehydrogenase [Myxococcales bacterium]|tara:strand:+ start:1203 stop:2507 length:1305 start_codon:yes stop_codon:yes gene_type:complete